MKKRVLSLFLALVLILGLLPASVLAADGGAVDVYIIGRDDLITYQRVQLDEAAKLDLSAYTSSRAEGCTALHAIVAALKAENLLDEFTCSGGYISKIGELEAGKPNYMSGWMFKHNNQFPAVATAECVLEADDEIVLFWQEGLEGQLYAQFDVRKAEVKTGEKLTLTAQSTPLDLEDGLGKEIAFDALSVSKISMLVYVDGKPYPACISPTKGTVEVYFSTPGTYVVTAVSTNQTNIGKATYLTTTAACVVTVTGDALPSAGGLKTISLSNALTGEFIGDLTLEDGVQDYYVNTVYGTKGIKYTLEYDELATSNGAGHTLLYCYNGVSNTLGGKPVATSRKAGVTTGSAFNCLGFGDNEVDIFVMTDLSTHAYTLYRLHINRSSESPNATLSTMGISACPDELASSSDIDLYMTMWYILRYQDASGNTATCYANKLNATVRDYTLYLPYETEHFVFEPQTADSGTCVVKDAEGNVLEDTRITFQGEQMTLTIETTSSDGTGHETYTLTVVRRPNAALTDATIDCGRLWLHGVVPGLDKLIMFIPDKTVEEYTATFTAAEGTKIYLGSVAPENLLTDGKVTRPTPAAKKSTYDYFTLYLVYTMEDGTDYIRKVEVTVADNSNGLEMIEYVTSPSQHTPGKQPSDSSVGTSYLSSFGGYVTYRLTTPIQNDPSNPYGIDFIVYGNPNYPNVWSFTEPAQVYVAQDLDGDGEPDKWYALAGSEHYEDSTYWDYEITYTDEGSGKVRWDDNYGNTGYVCGLSSGCSFPSSKLQEMNTIYDKTYEDGTLTLSGILVGPIKSESYIYAPISIFGYGDCYPGKNGGAVANPYRDPGLSTLDPELSEEEREKKMTDLYGQNSGGDGMDISWAVDEDGNPVYLEHIDFIKLMSAVNVDAGAFSEKSPEITLIRTSVAKAEEEVGVTDAPEKITINGVAVDLENITFENGQASATVYLRPGETSAAIEVDAGERNVILGNRYRTSYTYETVSENGRMVRIITQEGEKEPCILVLTIRLYGPETAVMEQIDAIGEVTKESKDSIEEARKAYDRLSDEQKARVENYDVLLAAEELLNHLLDCADGHHTTTVWTTVLEPTCADYGYKTSYCDYCHELQVARIEKLPHSYKDEVVEPTCELMGYTVHTCEKCGHSYVDTYVPTLDHEYEQKISKEPTCTEEGEMTFTCKHCGRVYTQVLPKAEHEMQTTVVKATCEEVGYTEHKCAHCDYGYISDLTQPTGHRHTKLEGRKDATCTEKGHTGNLVCTDCGKTVEYGESIPATGHDYGEWKVTKDADCFKDGEMKRSCKHCDAFETKPIPAGSNECPSGEFKDVDTNLWYHEAIDYVVENGLMQGRNNGTFGPNEQTTRAEFVQVLYRLAGSPSVEGIENPFKDIDESFWGYDAIVWAANNGIVNGMSEGKFEPNATITREQIVTILFRYCDAEAVAEDALSEFPDADKVNAYAKDAMNWAIANGLIVGMGGKLEPQGAATRAQIATIVMRVCKNAK